MSSAEQALSQQRMVLHMDVIQTARLTLRRATGTDAPFIVHLLNDPGWLRWIGDRGVRDENDAREYVHERLDVMHSRHGVSLLVAETRVGAQFADRNSAGLCGLIKRDTLDDVDLGYAFLPKYRGQGLAFEAASAVLEYGHGTLGLTRIVAITLPGNSRSATLLKRLGFCHERTYEDDDSEETLSLYAHAS